MKKLIAFICWAEVLFMWLCAGCRFINAAETHRIFSIPGLLFPISAIIVVLTAVVCAFVARRQLLILLLGMAVCFHSFRDYCPFNFGTSIPEENFIKVMTYNTLGLGEHKTDDAGDFQIAHYIGTENPHIACLQEANFRYPADQESFLKTIEEYGYDYKWLAVGDANMGVASKFPIVDYKEIFHCGGNGAAAFFVLPPQQDTIVVINAHLESMHLSAEDRGQYHAIVKNLNHADTIKGKRTILSKIANAGVERARQADLLAHFVDSLAGKRIILTGDFNDTPISYAHYQICKRLTDAFKTAGNGMGRSFSKDAIIVRIDNIFCSSHWIPQYTYVEKSVNYSDHYPIISYLKENDGQ